MSEHEPTTALARLDVRAVALKAQTAKQRRRSFAVMFGGLFLVFTGLAGAPPAIMGLVGGAVGMASIQVRHAGRRRLHRQVRRLDEPAARLDALRRLEWLATRARGVVASVRVEAAGHVALHRIELGDFEGAVDVMNAASRDVNERERQRLPTQGFLGEAMRSLLARLEPGCIPGIVMSDDIVSDLASAEAPHADFDFVILAVRLLEALAEGAMQSAGRRWDDLSAHPRAEHHRALHLVIGGRWLARASEPGALRAELHERLEGLDEAARDMVVRLAPILGEALPGGYRQPAAAATSTVALVPVPLRELRPRDGPTRWLPALPRRSRRVFAGVVGVYGLVSLLSIFTGDPMNFVLMSLLSVAFVPSIVAAPIHRRRRCQLLVRAGVIDGPDDPRWAELRVMPARGGAAKSDAANLHPLDAVELRVLVGLARAETALAEGDVEAAERWIGWWLDTVPERGFDGISTLALGSSALRVAALLGRIEAGKALHAALAPGLADPRVVERNFPRTGHGDALKAAALATALWWARQDRWEAASACLERASRMSPLTLGPFDRKLYGDLARSVAERGLPVPDAFIQWSPDVQ